MEYHIVFKTDIHSIHSTGVTYIGTVEECIKQFRKEFPNINPLAIYSQQLNEVRL